MRSEVVDVVLNASRALIGVVARSMSDALEQVTLPQFRVLTILCTDGAQPVRQLADRLDVAPSTMSRSIDRLVTGGWVLRHENPDDHRENLVTATEQARRLVGDVAVKRRRILADALADLSKDDAETVRAGFEVFLAATGETVVSDLELLGRRGPRDTGEHADGGN